MDDNTKKVFFVVPGAGDDAPSTRQEVEIDEFATPADILQAAGLSSDNYRIEVLIDEDKDTYKVLSNNDAIYDLVEDNQKVFGKPSDIFVGCVG